LVNNFWRFDIKAGKYMISGLAESLEKAENKAYFALTRIPNNGTIHSVYVDGKAVKTRI
jgi:dihydroxyacetone kinase-like predicted kinase